MQNTANNKSGGITAAEQLLATTNHSDRAYLDHLEDLELKAENERLKHLPYREGHEPFDAFPLPPWAEELYDKAALKFNLLDGFYHVTKEDFICGCSHNSSSHESFSLHTVYDLGLYGDLNVAAVSGHPWCSLRDAGRILGVPISTITGFDPDDQICVRAEPGLLNPDGIRCLRRQGIRDEGIRLEALLPLLREHRENDQRLLEMVSAIAAEIHAARDLGGDPVDVRRIDLSFYFPLSPQDQGKIRLQSVYDPYSGEIKFVLLGTQLWVNSEDVGKNLWLGNDGVNPTTLIQMAGSARTLVIPAEKFQQPCNVEGAQTFLRSDAVEKFYEAMPPSQPYHSPPYIIELLNKLRDFIESGQGDETVKASSLHQMLGGHLEFSVWSRGMQRKHWALFWDSWLNNPFEDGEDYPIPVTLARDIAANEGGFAGDVTAKLLADSGYLHGGAIDETADATLRRFVGLIPDAHGRVQIRKVWEFSSTGATYEDWLDDKSDCILGFLEDYPHEDLTKGAEDLLPRYWDM